MSQNTSTHDSEPAAPSRQQSWPPLRWSGPSALVGALVTGGLLFFLFDALGAFPSTALAPPNGHPMSLKKVSVDATIGGTVGPLVFWVLTRVSDTPVKWFKYVSVVVVIIYSIAPFVLITNAPPRMNAALIVMNIAVGLTVFWILTYPE